MTVRDFEGNTSAALRPASAPIGRERQTDVFVRRLSFLYPLQPHEQQAVDGLVESVFHLPPQHAILEERQSKSEALVLLEGLACHFKPLENARRQMTGFVVPGDFCDFDFLSSSSTGQAVVGMTATTIGRISLARLSAVAERVPNIVVAALRGAAVDRASARELVVSLGARDALKRLAHLICELHMRLSSVGLVDSDNRFDFAITQAEMGEALGLSTVHVNRTIQQLRRRQLIAMGHGTVQILDLDGLAAIASFDPSYLKSD
jgi:CRP-like cAMP-binding protein